MPFSVLNTVTDGRIADNVKTKVNNTESSNSKVDEGYEILRCSDKNNGTRTAGTTVKNSSIGVQNLKTTDR